VGVGAIFVALSGAACSSGPNWEAYCDKAQRTGAASQILQAGARLPTTDAETFEEALEDIRAAAMLLEDVAPDEMRDDVEVLATREGDVIGATSAVIVYTAEEC
jgi:uncharacterized membrane protein